MVKRRFSYHDCLRGVLPLLLCGLLFSDSVALKAEAQTDAQLIKLDVSSLLHDLNLDASLSFCFGSHLTSELSRSFQFPPPPRMPSAVASETLFDTLILSNTAVPTVEMTEIAYDAICSSENAAAHICSPVESSYYFQYFLSTGADDTTHVPDNRWCDQRLGDDDNGISKVACSAGWFGLKVNGTSWLTDEGEGLNAREMKARDLVRFSGLRNGYPVPCCDGYFCPPKLQCMLPCPAGTHCRRSLTATLPWHNNASSIETDSKRWCAPYAYEAITLQAFDTSLEEGNRSSVRQSCGGADFWRWKPRATLMYPDAPVPSSGRKEGKCPFTPGSIFCPGGMYCPDTTSEPLDCPRGYFCRPGSIEPTPCLSMIDRCAACTVHPKRNAAVIIEFALLFSSVIFALVAYRWIRTVLYLHSENRPRPESLTFQRIGDDGSANEQLAEIELQGIETAGTPTFPPHWHTSPREAEASSLERNLSEMYGGNIDRIDIVFTNLGLHLRSSKKALLSQVSGQLRSGRTTAIMGASGSGKSSFLLALLDRGKSHLKRTGSIHINGKRATLRKSTYQRVVGFMPQEELVYRDLTVSENLVLSAAYRLPTSLSHGERLNRVKRILEILGIMEVRDCIVGGGTYSGLSQGISGGQRRRVSLGLELVVSPSVLLVDEPTSGLDSTSSRYILNTMKACSEQGVTVVAVVHQPSSQCFSSFDDLLLLMDGGRAVFSGRQEDCRAYFSQLGFVNPAEHYVNPAELYLDICQGVLLPSGSEANEGYIASDFLPAAWREHFEAAGPCGMCEDVTNDLESEAFFDESDECDESDENPLITRVPSSESELSFLGSQRPRGAVAIILQEIQANVKNFYHCLPFRTISNLMKLSPKQLHTKVIKALTESNRLRSTPGFLGQFLMCLKREIWQAARRPFVIVTSHMSIAIAGSTLGFMNTGRPLDLSDAQYSIITISILSVTLGQMPFSRDREMYRRQASSGLNRLSYFIAKNVLELFSIFFFALMYILPYQALARTEGSFLMQYYLTYSLIFCCTGIAIVISLLIKQHGAAAIFSIMFTLIWILVSSSMLEARKRASETFLSVSFSHQALRGFIAIDSKALRGPWLVLRCGSLRSLGFTVQDLPRSIGYLILHGCFYRFLALSIFLMQSN